jgi:hypothetical protein
MADADDDYSDQGKRLLRSEMVKRGVTYEALSERLAVLGVHDSPVNLRNKVARGKFMAAFLLHCLKALEVQALRLEDD